ncbi:stimulus-sensing domain-containing protein, partial [Enterococcus faecalis]|uniref:stimulus-sensing domain-containing protein n=1 Tax=Enterococcus faecalis TaxID=1351 RepID=UPI003D6A71CD
GALVLDSQSLSPVVVGELPPLADQKPGFTERVIITIRTWLNRGDLPLYRELSGENGTGYSEVRQALDGQKASMVRINNRGEVIVSVAVPV